MTDRKSTIPVPRQRLLKLMQHMNFGRIEGLGLRDGQPVLEPGPKVVREMKFGGGNRPRPEAAQDDIALKTQVVELFEQFDRLGNGTVATLVVKHGLPFSMAVETAA